MSDPLTDTSLGIGTKDGVLPKCRYRFDEGSYRVCGWVARHRKAVPPVVAPCQSLSSDEQCRRCGKREE